MPGQATVVADVSTGSFAGSTDGARVPRSGLRLGGGTLVEAGRGSATLGSRAMLGAAVVGAGGEACGLARRAGESAIRAETDCAMLRGLGGGWARDPLPSSLEDTVRGWGIGSGPIDGSIVAAPFTAVASVDAVSPAVRKAAWNAPTRGATAAEGRSA